MRKNIIVLIILGLLITACEFSWDWLEDLEGEDIIACDVAALIQAIEDANNTPDTTDTINLPVGCIYTLTEVYDDSTIHNNGLPSITSPIIINGNYATIQRSFASGTPLFRIFLLAGWAGDGLTLNNVTLLNGKAPDTPTFSDEIKGGAIYNLGSLSITGCSFSGNSATGGGAIYNLSSGSLIITNTEFTNNHAASSGGAILNIGTASITESTFSENDAELGGGAIRTFDEMTIVDSSFTDNFAESGGAISNSYDLTIVDSSFTGNEAELRGGAIDNQGSVNNSDLLIQNSTINTNSAVYAAIDNLGNSELTVTNSTISGNSSYGIFNSAVSSASIMYSTIVNNQEIGVYSASSDIQIGNSIIANNSLSDCVLSSGYNFYGVNLDTDGTCPGPGLLITADPLLGPLADNGGPTQTHALTFGSPAIDSATGDCPADDQRGEARPYGSACDLGAYEAASFFGFIASSTFCYYSPDSNYIAAHSLQAGTQVELVGYSEDLSYLAINSPRNPGLICYVDKEYLTLPDPLPYLPILNDPPPPVDRPDPGDDSPDEPQACHSGLSGPACSAAGGVWNISTNPASCDCP